MGLQPPEKDGRVGAAVDYAGSDELVSDADKALAQMGYEPAS